MTDSRPTQDLQLLVKSLASVSMNSKRIDILIFGAGLGGLAMLEVLSQSDDISIHAIVDIIEDAPAFQLARQLGITTSTDRTRTLERFNGDIIIDVTGNAELYDILYAFTQPHHIELISSKSAKLLFDMANQELRNERTIETQSTRLSLLNCMLEITQQLEHHPAICDVTSRSFDEIHNHINAIKGLAIIFNKTDEKPRFVGAIGETMPLGTDSPPELSACLTIQSACNSLSRDQRYKVFEPPVSVECSEFHANYNVLLPLWQDTRLAGLLLFDIALPLGKEQVITLEMSSVHLNMTFKTLEHFERLEEMAIFDSLTGVFNRRKFDMQLHQEISRIKRNQNGILSCGFIDLDNFKPINDTYGHPTGDLVLQHIARSIEGCLRDYDLCARYGGDEFVILAPADSANMEAVGLRILKQIAQFRLESEPELRISASIGIATQSSDQADAELLLKQADKALYQAKKSGKGCLIIHGNETVSLFKVTI
ncbi:MAG: GGDEF domain-containing protein [Mariprofundus sp.]|nr:GGDEF domain-containing protein [Mariprofundus sp.]